MVLTSRVMTSIMSGWRRILALFLVIFVVLIGTYFLVLDKSQFFQFGSASLNFELHNETDQPLSVYFTLSFLSGNLKFNETKITKLHGNFTVWEMSDGSRIEVDYSDLLTPSDYLSFRVEEIKPTSLLKGIGDTRFTLSFLHCNESDFGYSGVASLVNNQGISIVSQYIHTVRLDQNRILLLNEDRTASQPYLNAMIASLMAFSIGIVSMNVWQRARWFPLVSTTVVLVTLSLYVFVGSGFEIEVKNWWWLFPLSIFIHGSDWHIFGNLFYFTILSVLFESFLKMKVGRIHFRRALWYLVPLFSPLVLTVLGLVSSQQFSFGLSYSIEWLTWASWGYIILNFQELVKNKIHILMAILSGIPSFTFLGWIVSYSFGSSSDPYTSSLAIWHIAVGVVGGIVFVFGVFGHDIRQRLRNARIHLPL